MQPRLPPATHTAFRVSRDTLWRAQFFLFFYSWFTPTLLGFFFFVTFLPSLFLFLWAWTCFRGFSVAAGALFCHCLYFSLKGTHHRRFTSIKPGTERRKEKRHLKNLQPRLPAHQKQTQQAERRGHLKASHLDSLKCGQWKQHGKRMRFRKKNQTRNNFSDN